MGKKNSNGNGVMAAGGVSLLEKYKGQTESRGGFNPIWKPSKEGEGCLAEFIKVDVVIGQGAGKKKKDDFNSYVLKIEELQPAGMSIFKSKTIPTPAAPGVVFSASGDVLGSALKDAKAGEKYIILYLGLGEARNGNNAPKLFEVHALVEA